MRIPHAKITVLVVISIRSHTPAPNRPLARAEGVMRRNLGGCFSYLLISGPRIPWLSQREEFSMADSKKKTTLSSQESTNATVSAIRAIRPGTKRRYNRAQLQAALEKVYEAHGRGALEVREEVERVMHPVGMGGRPTGLQWYAPLTLNEEALGEWARATAVAFIGSADLGKALRPALLNWRGLVEIFPNKELGEVKTSTGKVRTIASLQQLMDEDPRVISRIVGAPVREAFAAYKRRKAIAEERARKEQAEADKAASLVREEEANIAALLAQAKAQISSLQREARLGEILAGYEAEISAAQQKLAANKAAAEKEARAAAVANSALLATAGVGRIMEAMNAGNDSLAAAWAAYAGAKT